MDLPAAPATAPVHLYARSAFLEQVELAIHRPASDAARPIALLVARLDGFRLFNDCYGYAAGDLLLEQIAARLRALAVTLTLGTQTAVRLGHLHADEFGVLLTGLPEHAADGVAAALLARLSGPYRFGLQETVASFSLGCSCAVAGEGTASQFVAEARAAMRRARALGGGRHEIFSAQARARFGLQAHIGRDLHRAIAGGQFSLVYQPIIGLESFRVEGVEALLRWQHPELGAIPPSEFIPIAVECGQIGAIGDYVLQRACVEFAALRKLPALSSARFVAINVSRRNLDDQQLPAKVIDALNAGGLDPETLHLEITESELANNFDATLVTVNTLRSLGVGLVIDDFGVGYSSLASLHEFPVDVLKLDRSFVAGDVHSRKGRGLMAVAHATINLARNIGLKVVAEGVEKPAQLAVLHSLQCDMAQGWLLGAALTPAELRDYRVTAIVQ